MQGLAILPDNLRKRILEKKKKLELKGKLPTESVKKIEERMQIEFVYNSNKIENVALTRGETELILRGMTIKNQNMLKVLSTKDVSDILAAQNHPDAIEFVKKLAFDSHHKITENDIKDIHAAIMNSIIGSAGKYREFDLTVKGAEFTPPPFYEVPDHMRELIEFMNENPGELRPIELAAHVHYYFAWIHPFENGNGRMARLLLNFILVRNGYPFAVIKNVEKKKYLETLRLADRGDFLPSLIYIARCIEQTLDLYLLGLADEKGNKPELLPLKELTKGTPYSAEYLSLLARKGMLDAVREGRVWKSTRKTIQTYIDQHGRK